MWISGERKVKNRENIKKIKKNRQKDRKKKKRCFEFWNLAVLTFTCLDLERNILTLSETEQGANKVEAERETGAKVSVSLKQHSVNKYLTPAQMFHQEG